MLNLLLRILRPSKIWISYAHPFPTDVEFTTVAFRFQSVASKMPSDACGGADNKPNGKSCRLLVGCEEWRRLIRITDKLFEMADVVKITDDYLAKQEKLN